MVGDKKCDEVSRDEVEASCAVADPLAVIPGDAETEAAMERILATSMGMRRDGDSLRKAQGELAELLGRDVSPRMRNRLQLAAACVACAIAREESRGAHMRVDFPERSDAFKLTTIAEWADGAPQVSFAQIGAPIGGESA